MIRRHFGETAAIEWKCSLTSGTCSTRRKQRFRSARLDGGIRSSGIRPQEISAIRVELSPQSPDTIQVSTFFSMLGAALAIHRSKSMYHRLTITTFREWARFFETALTGKLPVSESSRRRPLLAFQSPLNSIYQSTHKLVPGIRLSRIRCVIPPLRSEQFIHFSRGTIEQPLD